MSGAIDLSLNPIGESQITPQLKNNDDRYAWFTACVDDTTIYSDALQFLTYCTQALHSFQFRKKNLYRPIRER